ncbi:MAG: glycosyltransferase family 1 protein [Candidatus Omnitrophota bacterium]
MWVRIFKNIKSEYNPSMHVYAQQLLKYMPSNVDDFSVKAKNYHFLRYYFAKEFVYPKEAAKNQADVNHISDHSYSGLLRGLDPEKTAVTCHDIIPLIDIGAISWLGKKRFWFNVKLMPKAKKIIAVSEFTKGLVLEKFRNISRDKISVIPYGVDETFRPVEQKEALRQKYNISKKSVLHVGSSYPRKNVELILEILTKRKDWQFVKVGPFSKRQCSYIRKNNLNKRILHFPRIDLNEREKLTEVYNSVSVLAYPSFYEGFGMPVLEAMACGCPVVCSDIPPFFEIAEGSAVFVDPKNAKLFEHSVDKIFEDAEFRLRSIQEGFCKAKHYSWKDSAEKTYKIYEEIYRAE